MSKFFLHLSTESILSKKVTQRTQRPEASGHKEHNVVNLVVLCVLRAPCLNYITGIQIC